MLNDVINADSKTVFSHKRLQASATPSKPFNGDRGVHHFRPIVKLARRLSLFAKRSANVVYRVLWPLRISLGGFL